MSEYHLDILDNISLGDYSKLDDYMAIVGVNDKFVISLNKDSVKNANLIYNMLENNNFIINSKGGNEYGKLFITASRNKG